MTDPITTYIVADFKHELTAEIRRQTCQGIHSTYSACTIFLCFFIRVIIFILGLKLYYGSYGYSDGLYITSDLSTNSKEF
jgi:hypothetical protein